MSLFKARDSVLINGKLYEITPKICELCTRCPFVLDFGCSTRMKFVLGLPMNKYKSCVEIFGPNNEPVEIKNKIHKWKYVSGR